MEGPPRLDGSARQTGSGELTFKKSLSDFSKSEAVTSS